VRIVMAFADGPTNVQNRNSVRSPASITWAVWKALFLREAVARLFAGRAAWVWILVEPVVHLGYLYVLFGFILQRLISGVEGGMFITTGVLGYLMVQNTAMRSKEAITANMGLFTYRQVFPIDTVLVRAALEAVLLLVSALFLLTGLGLFGSSVLPHDVLSVMAALSALWLSGLGLGLMMSVANELIPEVGKITDMLFRPLYFLSGIMYPVSAIPPAYRDWLLVNPFVHGIETLRTGFFPQYHAVDGVSLAYLMGFALVTLCLGLALHVRFGGRLVAQ
jgi:capsular polysaccharide transport system permease protein